MVVRRDLPQFQGKAVIGRALVYPAAAAVVPAVWVARGRRDRYPYDVDILVVLPFLIDTAGNAADLYDTISWWDDLNHFVNWAILVCGFGRLLVRLPVGRLNAFALALGFGCVTAVLWELAEYLTFIRNNEHELRTAYTDTLGDLALGGIAGSTVAATLTATVLWPRDHYTARSRSKNER